jgi:hypothetical protein
MSFFEKKPNERSTFGPISLHTVHLGLGQELY